MIRTLIAAVILSASTLPVMAQDAKKADAPAAANDLAKLQGKWSAMVGPDKRIPIIFEFKDKSFSIHVTFNGEEATLTGDIKIDDTKSPKEIDFLNFTGPGGESIGDNLGIYKLEGDELTSCSGGPGNDRPTEFKAGDGGAPNLTVFKRVIDDVKKDEPKKESK